MVTVTSEVGLPECFELQRVHLAEKQLLDLTDKHLFTGRKTNQVLGFLFDTVEANTNRLKGFIAFAHHRPDQGAEYSFKLPENSSKLHIPPY